MFFHRTLFVAVALLAVTSYAAPTMSRRIAVNAVVARAEPSADLATILTNVVDAIEMVAGKDIEKATALLKETKPMIKALDSTGGGGGAGTIPDKEPITEPTTTGVKEPESTIVSDDIM